MSIVHLSRQCKISISYPLTLISYFIPYPLSLIPYPLSLSLVPYSLVMFLFFLPQAKVKSTSSLGLRLEFDNNCVDRFQNKNIYNNNYKNNNNKNNITSEFDPNLIYLVVLIVHSFFYWCFLKDTNPRIPFKKF